MKINVASTVIQEILEGIRRNLNNTSLLVHLLLLKLILTIIPLQIFDSDEHPNKFH